MELLFDGDPADPVFVMAHGAGAAMDGPGMTDLASRIASQTLCSSAAPPCKLFLQDLIVLA